MTTTYYSPKELTGGGADALDFIDGAGLNDDDIAIVSYNNIIYFYRLESTSGAAENSPYVISPDTNAGNKRWLLQSAIGFNAPCRAKFNYIDADQISAEAATYMCKDKYCFWTSTITTTAIAAPAANTTYYLYLDYSAITSGTPITNAELIWSTTKPSFNTTYRCLMNGDDRCIFAVKTDGSNNIREFFHNGEFIAYADDIADANNIDTDTAWTDVTLTIPEIAIMASVELRSVYVDVAVTAYWRTNGQAGTTGHRFAYVSAAAYNIHNTLIVVTDNSQKIEFKVDGAGGTLLSARTQGWYLPPGM